MYNTVRKVRPSTRDRPATIVDLTRSRKRWLQIKLRESNFSDRGHSISFRKRRERRAAEAACSENHTCNACGESKVKLKGDTDCPKIQTTRHATCPPTFHRWPRRGRCRIASTFAAANRTVSLHTHYSVSPLLLSIPLHIPKSSISISHLFPPF